MSNRNLALLGVIAVLMAVLAVFQSSVTKNKPGAGTEQFYLLQGLDTGLIAAVEIISGDKQVTLKRAGEGFVASGKDNYPVMVSRISELITTCLDIKTVEHRTSNPANHADLGVAESNAQNIVKFMDEQGGLITGVVISKADPENNKTYVRHISGDDVYLVSESVWIRTSVLDYVEAELLSVERDKIRRVVVSGFGEGYTLKAGDEAGEVILEDVPEGREVKSNDIKQVFTALTSLQFDDVRRDLGDGEELKFDLSYVCQLEDSTIYTLSIARSDGSTYIKCMVEFTDKTPVTKEQGVESQEQLKEKEAKLLALENAEKFTKRHAGWIYKIPEYKAVYLTKKLPELLEDIKEEETGEDETEQVEAEVLGGE